MTLTQTDKRKPSKAIDEDYDLPTRIEDVQMGNIIGYQLRKAQLAVFQYFQEVFSELKLRPAEFSVLSLIIQEPGQKQSEIAQKLGIKRANFVALMDTLEQRGLAERRKGEKDRRSHSLYITQEGERFMKKCMIKWHEHEKNVIRKLGGKEESRTLIKLLSKLTHGGF